MKKLKFKGFTLAELLISSAIFITVSTVIITALFSAFRLNKKSETFLIAKQNGDAALSQMVRSIKYARSLDDPENCVIPVTSSEITVSSSSDIGQTTLACPNETSDTIASNGATLVDTSSIQVIECSFTCSQATVYSPPTITIKFALGTFASGSGFIESTTTVPFQTSVTMRNFLK